MSKKFKRQDYMRHLKLGKKSSKPSWRKPKGRHSKMRRSRKSYPITVSIGYKKPKTPHPILIHNLNELKKIKNKEFILAKISARKKLEIIKYAKENRIKILNVKGEKNETRN